MRRALLCLITGAACLAGASASAQESNDDCLVDEAKQAYSEVNSSITEQTQETIEDKNPSGEQDFTEMGCINGFSIGGQLGLPDLGLGDLMDPCSMVKDFADQKLNALNDAIGNWEGPAGLSGGLRAGTETGEGGKVSEAFESLDGYRDKLQEQADTITEDREAEQSYTPGVPEGARR